MQKLMEVLSPSSLHSYQNQTNKTTSNLSAQGWHQNIPFYKEWTKTYLLKDSRMKFCIHHAPYCDFYFKQHQKEFKECTSLHGKLVNKALFSVLKFYLYQYPMSLRYRLILSLSYILDKNLSYFWRRNYFISTHSR